jgi:Tol biopolymer transport system component
LRFTRIIVFSLDPSRPKRRLDDYAGLVDETRRRDGPALSPVYFSVARKKLSRTEVRNLDGSAYKETDSTNCSASVSPLVQVGSFANVDDKRQNLIVHRHDHANMHNIRTSFDPSTLITPPARGHKVLHHSVDGTDVRLNSISVFKLDDKNFPPMVPAGGGGGWRWSV